MDFNPIVTMFSFLFLFSMTHIFIRSIIIIITIFFWRGIKYSTLTCTISLQLHNQLSWKVEEVAISRLGIGSQGWETFSEFPKSQHQNQELLSLNHQSQVSNALSIIPYCFYWAPDMRTCSVHSWYVWGIQVNLLKGNRTIIQDWPK